MAAGSSNLRFGTELNRARKGGAADGGAAAAKAGAGVEVLVQAEGVRVEVAKAVVRGVKEADGAAAKTEVAEATNPGAP